MVFGIRFPHEFFSILNLNEHFKRRFKCRSREGIYFKTDYLEQTKVNTKSVATLRSRLVKLARSTYLVLKTTISHIVTYGNVFFGIDHV